MAVKIHRRRASADQQQLTMLAAAAGRARAVTRAVTLTQPWAGLVASGLKLVENRDKSIIAPQRFGETFGIHASRELVPSIYDRIREIAPELFDGWSPNHTPQNWPAWYRLSRITSSMIGVATVVRRVDDYDTLDAILGEQRRWYFGPIGFVLRDVRALTEPVRCKGGLSNWEMPVDVAARVNAQIARSA